MVATILIFIFLYFLAVLITSIFCRKMRKKARNFINKKNTNILPDINNTKKSGCLKAKIFNFCYGLSRYTNIMCGKIPSFKFRNLLYRFVFCMEMKKKTIIMGGVQKSLEYKNR